MQNERSEDVKRQYTSMSIVARLLHMKTTIDIPQLIVFTQVVRSGSFTGAAEKLGSNKAYLSRVVSTLEKRLGVRLLQRSTRAHGVTESGKEFFERATAILAAIDDTERAMLSTHSEPSGTLKLTCGMEFGVLAVNRWISEYLTRYANVKVDVDYTHRLADIIHEGIDIAIRLGKISDSELRARKLGELSYGFYATHQYLTREGVPEHPDELAEHDILYFGLPDKTTYNLINGREKLSIPVNARFKANNVQAVRDICLADLGIAMLPRQMAGQLVNDQRLIPLLPEWSRATVPVHAVFPSSKYMAPKSRAFIDIASSMFDETVV